MSVFAGFSAALATQAIGKKAYTMTKPKRMSRRAIATPRRGDTACAVSEVLTDLLQLPRQAEVEGRDPCRDQEDEHRERGRKAVVDAAAALAAGEREAERVRDEDVRRPGGLRRARDRGAALRDEVDEREVVEVEGERPDQERPEGGEQERQRDEAEALDAARAVDRRRLEELGRDRLQRPQRDEEHVRIAEPQVHQEDRDLRKRRIAEPLRRDAGQAAQHLVELPVERVQEADPDQRA